MSPYGAARLTVSELVGSNRVEHARQSVWAWDQAAVPFRMGICGPPSGRSFVLDAWLDVDGNGARNAGDLATSGSVPVDLDGERCPTDLTLELLR
jgi:hypothetical protein